MASLHQMKVFDKKPQSNDLRCIEPLIDEKPSLFKTIRSGFASASLGFKLATGAL